MNDTKIEWTDRTWMVDRGGRRVRSYQRRGDLSTPGRQERRRHLALGEKWCRDCAAWRPAADVTRQGLCREHRNAAYRARYAEDGAAIRQRVYARKRSLDPIPGWWVQGSRDDFDGLCAYGCGSAATTNDHVWPVALGGRSDPGNLAPACVSCNSSKRASHPAPWVDRGMSVFPGQWIALATLAVEHGTDQWTEVA
jgi:5-methylcytosine-specific restriction endonuclease McrA